MRVALRGSSCICLLVGGALLVRGVLATDRVTDSAGITIPIQPVSAPLRRGEPDATPLDLRGLIQQAPREAPHMRLRKPPKTQFADMDLATRAG